MHSKFGLIKENKPLQKALLTVKTPITAIDNCMH